MQVHVVPKEGANLHLMSCCWCKPRVDDVGVVSHEHPQGNHLTDWLVIRYPNAPNIARA